MKRSVNLFGALDNYSALNIGWQNVGGRYVSYGSQSPEDDDDDQWFRHETGDLRLYVGDDDVTVYGWRCTVGGTPGTWTQIDFPSSGVTPVFTFDRVVDLRNYLGPIGPDFLFFCRGYMARGDGGEGFYRLDFDTSAPDDGVLLFQLNSNPAGPKFRFINLGNDVMFKAQRCGTAVPATPRLSFDPTGTVIIGSELNRVSALLAGSFAGINFGPGRFQFDGSEHLAPRPRDVGFEIRGSGNTVFFQTSQPTHTQPINVFAVGDEGSLVASGYGMRTWTQTDPPIAEGDSIFPGVSDITGLSVGDIVLCRFGADPTDGGGIWFTYVFGEIKALTPTEGPSGDVEIYQCCPEGMPSGVGFNPSRIQTKHDMMKVTGFQDNASFRNLIFEDVFVAGQFYRNLTLDDITVASTKGLVSNGLGGEGLRVPNIRINRATGGDVPASLFTLASQHDNYFGSISVDINPEDGAVLQILSREAQCRNTRIDSVFMKVKSATAQGTIVGFGGTTAGNMDMLNVGFMGLEGGAYQLICGPNMHVTTLDRKNVTNDCYVALRGDQVDNIVTSLGFYKNSKTVPLCPLPLAQTNTTTDYYFPLRGLTKSLRIKPNSMTGVTQVLVSGNDFGGTGADITAYCVPANWNDINQASVMSVASPNSIGYNALVLRIVTDGTTPAGACFEVEHTCFEIDLSNPAFTIPDTSLSIITPSNGPPIANAGFFGQVAFDQTNRRFYDAVDVGSGALDWIQRGISAVERAKLAYLPDRIDFHSDVTGSGTYLTPTWTAGKYRRLQLVIRVDNTGGETGSIDHILLTGPSGTYNFTEIYVPTAAGPPAVFNGTGSFPVNNPGGTALSGFAIVDIDIPTLGRKIMSSKVAASFNTGAFNGDTIWAASLDDVTNAVTGLSLVWAADTGPWSVELWGWP